jgi:hypothetical protein
MDRILSSQISDLMEAYSAVYAPQELTEEQVWEEVENWVNSLVEEGHDLSEYTWEDMYEAYIEEQGRNRTPQAVIDRNRAALGNRIMTGNPEGTRTPIRQTPNRRGGGTNKPQQGPTDKPGLMPGLSVGPGGFNIKNRPVQTTPARPAASAPARPAAKAPAPAARPAAKPATPTSTSTAKPAPTPSPKVTPSVPTPTSSTSRPSLAQQAAELRKMRMASQMRQKGANVVGSQMASFDPFDVIKGHLLDEGYADTEEAAAAIMANMSEDWKQTILEADSVAKMAERAAKRRQQRYGKQGGGGRDDFRPYTKDDYENPKPGYGSGAASQAKGA